MMDSGPYSCRCKSAEKLLLAGPLGVYLIQFCELKGERGQEVKGLLVDLLFAMELMMAFVHTD